MRHVVDSKEPDGPRGHARFTVCPTFFHVLEAALLEERLDFVITVCDHANARCPVFPGAVKRIHWSIDDPVIGASEQGQLEAFRAARDELQRRILTFVEEQKGIAEKFGDA